MAPRAGLAEAARVAERLRRSVAALAIPVPAGGVLTVTASFGVASIPDAAGDRDSLVAAADAALYVAKRAGKNRAAHAPALPTARANRAARFAPRTPDPDSSRELAIDTAKQGRG